MTPPSKMRWSYYLAAAISLAIIVVVCRLVLKSRRKNTAIILIYLMFGGFGCRGSSNPVTHVTGTFSRPKVVHEPNQTIATQLILTNDGNQSVRITHIDGGCSCRRVDQSPLPTTIKPGKSLTVGLTMIGGKRFEPLNIMFTLDTDQGSLIVPATIFTIPSHLATPEAPTNDFLTNDQDWNFQLVHRLISSDSDRDEVEIPSPDYDRQVFRITKDVSRRGELEGVSEFHFDDMTYQIELLDRSYGLKKSIIVFKGLGNHGQLEVPVTWRRSEYLSTVPRDIMVASQPVRAFLRCVDRDVELTKVLEAPDGIKAVINGPRELLVSISDNAPGVIRGTIRIATNAVAPKQTVFSVPVVRYNPTATK